MTEVVFLNNANHMIEGFICSGHAGYKRYGKDIVCSAISMLTINTVNSLQEIAGATVNVDADDKSGFISCILASKPDDRTQVLFESLRLGLETVANEYGSKYCKVTQKEEESC